MNGTQAVVDRLVQATNDHDLDGLVACFAEDYANETPVHPGRSFRGRTQVRQNWEQIFAFVPDLTAKVISSTIADETAWTEWEMTGTRRDGTAHQMRASSCSAFAAALPNGLGSTSSLSIRVPARSTTPYANRWRGNDRRRRRYRAAR
jgi:ketosteroid isomerase-like protein